MCLLENKKNSFSKSLIAGLLICVCIALFWCSRKAPEIKPDVDGAEVMTPESTKPESQAQSEDSTEAVQVKTEPSPSAAAVPASARTPEELDKITQLRSQVKMALSSGYTAMISFHAEYNRFSTDFRAMGFGPLGGSIPYKVGFLAPYVPTVTDPSLTSEDPNNMTSDFIDGQKYDPIGEKINLSDFARHCERGCTATDSEFEMIAVLPLPNSTSPDVWLINEKKEMRQVVDGLQ